VGVLEDVVLVAEASDFVVVLAVVVVVELAEKTLSYIDWNAEDEVERLVYSLSSKSGKLSSLSMWKPAAVWVGVSDSVVEEVVDVDMELLSLSPSPPSDPEPPPSMFPNRLGGQKGHPE
jgi:hypothetical protein